VRLIIRSKFIFLMNLFEAEVCPKEL
jgi:hypothetical protein